MKILGREKELGGRGKDYIFHAPVMQLIIANLLAVLNGVSKGINALILIPGFLALCDWLIKFELLSQPMRIQLKPILTFSSAFSRH